MRVLISPAHYYFSDQVTSEPGWSFSLTSNIANKTTSLDIIVGINDTNTNSRPGYHIYPIYTTRSIYPLIELAKYLLFYPLLFLRAIRLARSTSYDVVHHMFPSSIYSINPSLLFFKLIHPRPKIIIGPLQKPQSKIYPQDLNLMLVGKPGWSWLDMFIYYLFKVILSLVRTVSLFTFMLCDTVVCNSETSKAYYSQWINPKKIEVIPTGISSTLLRPLKPIQKSTRTIRILSVGQLTYRKGQIYLLEALSNLIGRKISAHLTLVGEGDQMTTYKSYVERHNLLDYVTFLGKIPHDHITSVYASHTIFCLPSLSESSPTVILEAMAAGLPIIATDVGTIKEMLGGNGLLVDPENIDSLVSAIIQLTKSPRLMTQFAVGGQMRIKNYYNWELIAAQWRDLYSL